MIALATGLAIRDGRVLLVASRYPNHAAPLWNLPGGRQQPGELLEETVAREVFEEAGLHAHVRELAYVSESYDGDTHFLNATFLVDVSGDVILSFDSATLRSGQAQGAETARDHIVGVDWVALDEVAERIVVAVVREPLLAYLKGVLLRRYAGFHDAGITIEWPAGSE
ncbi:MAG: NUDIX domain-containing protein [Candidatus Eremiobacteraeota bacterium]|nr:NUDIX domain-containing protein [Candidatus Eremiobacteraeota bacterium]